MTVVKHKTLGDQPLLSEPMTGASCYHDDDDAPLGFSLECPVRHARTEGLIRNTRTHFAGGSPTRSRLNPKENLNIGLLFRVI